MFPRPPEQNENLAWLPYRTSRDSSVTQESHLLYHTFPYIELSATVFISNITFFACCFKFVCFAHSVPISKTIFIYPYLVVSIFVKLKLLHTLMQLLQTKRLSIIFFLPNMFMHKQMFPNKLPTPNNRAVHKDEEYFADKRKSVNWMFSPEVRLTVH